ncbi:MAG: hypothetical protein M3495_09770, partial [Pseudomonadota bacterium]|nr:hypothetical protein [Pseudomonadota bacterium]
SALMKEGGCAIYDHLPGAAACARLLAESRLCLPGAVASTVATSDDEELRGGNPARRFISAGGGEEQAAFYRDSETARFLARICCAPVRPTGESGTYTYYARAGDHLALHRDIDTCDVAVVTCVLDRHHEGSAGVLTRFYPARQARAALPYPRHARPRRRERPPPRRAYDGDVRWPLSRTSSSRSPPANSASSRSSASASAPAENLDGDQGLYGTDFRAGERLAQQLVQVAGRTRRRPRHPRPRGLSSGSP